MGSGKMKKNGVRHDIFVRNRGEGAAPTAAKRISCLTPFSTLCWLNPQVCLTDSVLRNTMRV
jgi:hypothetical protein